MNARIGALLLIFSMLTACGNNPKTPNDANFRTVINTELAKRNPYCDKVKLLADRFGRIIASPLQEALTKHGILSPIPAKNYATFAMSETQWILTEKGKQIAPDLNTQIYEFRACMADGAEVAEVVNWTEPSSMFGVTVTEVTYTIKPTKVAAWVTPDIEPLLTQLKEERKKTIGLQLTAKGWQKSM